MADHSFDNYAGGGTLLDADGGTLLLDYEQLINLIEAEGKKLPCNQVIVKPELIIRESCRRIKLV